MARVPGSLAVATIVTCAIFATATGIVGAVVTLMGLLAFPAMLKAGYNVQVGAGAVTAGGCLGILIPPSVLLIVYGATAGVSVVQLYAGAFFPGIMLAALYVGYIIVLAKIKPSLMPPLSEEDRRVALPSFAQRLSHTGDRAVTALVRGLKGPRNADVPARTLVFQLGITLLPALVIVLFMGLMFRSVTAPPTVQDTQWPAGDGFCGRSRRQRRSGINRPRGTASEPKERCRSRQQQATLPRAAPTEPPKDERCR